MTLTEAQAKAKIPSKLLPYLASKSKAKLNDLFESKPMTTDPASISAFPALWADPSILCQTNAYEIARYGKLPELLEELADEGAYMPFKSLENIKLNNIKSSFEYSYSCILRSGNQAYYPRQL
jgi:hypothetical protein